ncbi:MAG TPA: 1-acyl-sn-glycerol-3-phosphate acyltransferase [Clostridiales bacterium UBA8153]|nr:1-acyl-sn-glycerol-3-phosphate acyltransferase [Clostridiales bacterium UBA8153]
MSHLLYGLVRGICWVILKGVFRAEVEGAHLLVKEGPVLLCANHIAWWDPPLISVASHRKVSFMAKEALFGNRLVGRLLKLLGAFPVRRHVPDRAAIQHALGLLEHGQVVGMFPEGTRSRSGELQKGLHGAALLALRSGAWVVPAGIVGAYRPGGRPRIRFGRPFRLEEAGRRSEALDRGSQRIMEEIAGLLKP